MARATPSRSPVSRTTRSPMRFRDSTTCRELGRMVSATAMTPAGRPSMDTSRGVCPWAAKSLRDGRRAPAAGPSHSSVPMRTSWLSTRALTPRPGTVWNCVASATPPPAALRTASASGCSDVLSAAAAMRSTSVSSKPGCAAIPVTAGRPSVTVPVLSSTTVSIERAFSSASPPRIRMPLRAPRPVATMTAVGTASPSRTDRR